MAKISISVIYVIFMVRVTNSKCYLPKLGMFDCGDGECISTDLLCDGAVNCNGTAKDESDCEDHFRRVCLQDWSILLNTDNFTNSYLGYNVISGYTQPFLDWHHVNPHVRRRADCRRAEADAMTAQSLQHLPLLPHNIANFTFTHGTALKTPEFQAAVFENAYGAFLDMKRRKSIVVWPAMTYEDLRSLTLPDAYKTSRVPGGDFYWFDEQTFWQANMPLIRFYLEKITGEFRLRPNDRLAINPEVLPDLSNAIRQTDQNNSDGNLWWKFFDRYGTHFPIGGTVGGAIEIIAKRKICSKKNSTGHAHTHAVTMADISQCLTAKIKRNEAAERLHCGKLEKKFGVQSVAEIIDWSHRRVIGGNASILGSPDDFPSTEQVDRWSKTVQSDARALSANLVAMCEVIDRFVSDDGNFTGDETPLQNSKLPCQEALVAYVKKKDVLHIPDPTMIPCREDAVAVWRLVDKKFVLRGLPWCLSTKNEDGSCPASASLPAPVFRALLIREPNTISGSTVKFYSIGLMVFLFLDIFLLL